jgi:hypothetical protein
MARGGDADDVGVAGDCDVGVCDAASFWDACDVGDIGEVGAGGNPMAIAFGDIVGLAAPIFFGFGLLLIDAPPGLGLVLRCLAPPSENIFRWPR